MSLWDPDILKYFQFEQFKEKSPMRQIGEAFYNMACVLIKTIPAGNDMDSALHRLLEARDAALKASMI